jgi:hypothetical protein
MASWWHSQQHQQQQSTGEQFDYPHPPQPMIPPPFFYEPHMIMVEGSNHDEYVMHSANNGNTNDSSPIDYHHRRNWFNG